MAPSSLNSRSPTKQYSHANVNKASIWINSHTISCPQVTSMNLLIPICLESPARVQQIPRPSRWHSARLHAYSFSRSMISLAYFRDLASTGSPVLIYTSQGSVSSENPKDASVQPSGVYGLVLHHQNRKLVPEIPNIRDYDHRA